MRLTSQHSRPLFAHFIKNLLRLLAVATLFLAVSQASAQIQLITYTNTSWKFHTNSVDPAYAPADAWVAPGFDDSTWPSGVGIFGRESTPAEYTDPSVTYNSCLCGFNTPIAQPPANSSSYFRTHFNWAGSPGDVSFRFTNYVDDSVVVYLNGNVLYSFNVTLPLPLAWNEFAPAANANPLGEGVPIVTNLLASGLVTGDNVLAVQLAQVGSGSSDDVFTLNLWATPPVPIAITQQPTNVTSVENRVVNLTVGVTGTAPRYQWYKGTNPPALLTDATNATYTIASSLISDTGDYYAVIHNAANTVTSRVARVTISNDTNGPVLLSVKADASFQKIILTWDETMLLGTAGEVSSYAIKDPSSADVFVDSVDYFGNVVVLNVPTMQPDADYSIEIDYQLDLVNNPTLPVGTPEFDPNGIATNFHTLAFCPGFTRFQAYYNRPATESIAAFVASAVYPNSPTFAFETNVLYWPQTVNPNVEQYAMRFSGLFVAPEDGLYQFNPSHDDPVRLRFHTGFDGSSSYTELSADCCTGLLDGPTLDVTLTAGQRYYYELIVHEFTGGDNAGLSVILPSGATNSPISAEYLAIAYDPATTLNVGIAQQPQGVTIDANHAASFSVVATNGGNSTVYQWQIDGGAGFTNVPGATESSITTGLQPLANDGQFYRAIVAVPGRSITSSSARLTVITDTNKPHVTGVAVGGVLNTLTVSFDELMDPVSMADLAHYQLTDSSNNVLSLSGAVAAGNNRSVTFTTPTLILGAHYTLHAQDSADASGNGLAPTNIVLQTGLGFALFEAYDTSSTAGNAVALLTAHPNYPNNPRERVLIPTFDSRNVYPDDTHEQYGARMSGWFTAPTTENYIFYNRSDDASELWLSTDNSPTNKVKIQEETGCCNTFSTHPSAPKPLVAGHSYYIELLYKEGTGGDFGQVAVKAASDPADPNTLTPIGGAFLSAADPTVVTPALTLRSSRSGDTTTLTWDAGARLQCATTLTPTPDWKDVDTGGATTYVVDPNNQFDVILDAAQAGGGGRTGGGSGTVTLSGSTLLVDVTYSGMSGNRTLDHFHAPAARGVSAGVVYDLGGITTGTTSGTVLGTVTLVQPGYGGKSIAAQVQDIRNSLWYLNIHSSTFGGGEIRGQVDPAKTRFYRLVSP